MEMQDWNSFEFNNQWRSEIKILVEISITIRLDRGNEIEQFCSGNQREIVLDVDNINKLY